MNRDMDKGSQEMQPPMPSHHDVNKILEAYFLKKGYSQSELAYIQESSDHNIVSLEQLTKKFNTSPTLPNHVQLIKQQPGQGGGDLDATMHSYQSLREWIFNALDLYKVKIMPHYLNQSTVKLTFLFSTSYNLYYIQCLFMYF